MAHRRDVNRRPGAAEAGWFRSEQHRPARL